MILNIADFHSKPTKLDQQMTNVFIGGRSYNTTAPTDWAK
jgi:hypothetical protein